MGLFRKSSAPEAGVPEELDQAPDCPHVALSPRWDNLDDMGHDDRISSYICQSCSEVFSPEEERRLRATEADRIGANN
jgi:transposase-like protein